MKNKCCPGCLNYVSDGYENSHNFRWLFKARTDKESKKLMKQEQSLEDFILSIVEDSKKEGFDLRPYGVKIYTQKKVADEFLKKGRCGIYYKAFFTYKGFALRFDSSKSSKLEKISHVRGVIKTEDLSEISLVDLVANWKKHRHYPHRSVEAKIIELVSF